MFVLILSLTRVAQAPPPVLDRAALVEPLATYTRALPGRTYNLTDRAPEAMLLMV